MATVHTPYRRLTAVLADSSLVWTTDTIKCALISGTYSPSTATHTNFTTSVQSFEAAGAGYTAGGATLTGRAVTTTTTGTGLGAATVAWAAVTVTCRYLVIYKTTSGDLLSLLDFGVSGVVVTAKDFIVQWAGGVPIEIKPG